MRNTSYFLGLIDIKKPGYLLSSRAFLYLKILIGNEMIDFFDAARSEDFFITACSC